MTLREFQKKLRNIQSIERGIKPDPAWLSRTRENLVARVTHEMPKEALSWQAQWQSAIRQYLPSRVVRFFRGPAMASLSIFGLVLGGSIASVSASERALPGDLLYPVKLATEQTRLALTPDATEKFKLKTEFVGRRVTEIQSIVSSDVSQKPQRIIEATEILKRDLDTVKGQLTDVTQQGSDENAAQAAKLLDQKSTEIAATLRDVKPDVPDGAKGNVVEAEAAAVNAGVKAVQVLIDSQNKPDAQNVMSHDEILQSIHDKVQGIEDNIADATQQLVTAGAVTSTLATSTTILTPSSTLALIDHSSGSSTSISEIKNVKDTLDQAKQLLSQNKLSEGTDKLLEASTAAVSVQNAADAITASSSLAIIDAPDASSTPIITGSASTTGSDTSTDPGLAATSTDGTKPTATSTPSK